MPPRGFSKPQWTRVYYSILPGFHCRWLFLWVGCHLPPDVEYAKPRHVRWIPSLTLLDNFYVGPETSVSEELLLTLPASLPLVAGALCLTGLGRKVGHWKWSMTVSMASLTLWLALLALITPYNKGMMITFVALAQFSYGWAAYLSVTYTQLGVPQEMLGISGGLAGTARYAGGAVAAACYSAALARGISSKAPELIGKAVNETRVPQSIIDQVMKAAPGGELALSAIPGMTAEMTEAVSVAYKYAVAHGLR